MAFVADDLTAWLISLVADAGRKKLTAMVLGSEQERALLSAATAAVRLTADELRPEDEEQAGQIALVINQVFSVQVPSVRLAPHGTMLEVLQSGIAEQLAVLDDASLTGTGESSSEVLGVPGAALAEKLTSHLLREIVARGARGGPLFPLASQLNDDVTHLQGIRLESMVGRLATDVRAALALMDRQGVGRAAESLVQTNPMHSLISAQARYVSRKREESQFKHLVEDGAKRIVFLGLPGIGKTWLASHLASGCAPIRFSSGRPRADDVLTALRVCGIETSVAVAHDPIAALAVLLTDERAPDFVFLDDVECTNDLLDSLPMITESVIIAACNYKSARLPPEWHEICIGRMNNIEAARMVHYRMPELSEKEASQLAHTLGGYPSVLDHVCGLLEAHGNISVAEFSRDYQGGCAFFKGDKRELARQVTVNGDESLLTVLRRLLARIADRDPLAHELLVFMALYRHRAYLDLSYLANFFSAYTKIVTKTVSPHSRYLQSLRILQDFQFIEYDRISPSMPVIEFQPFVRDVLYQEYQKSTPDVCRRVVSVYEEYKKRYDVWAKRNPATEIPDDLIQITSNVAFVTFHMLLHLVVPNNRYAHAILIDFDNPTFTLSEPDLMPVFKSSYEFTRTS